MVKADSSPSSLKNAGLTTLLWALGIAGFLVNSDNRAIAPVLPAISADLHIRESTAGLLVSAYAIPYGMFQLFYGPLSDRIGKLRTIMIALSLFALGTLVCGFVSSYSSLFVLRVITGIFAAGIIPISLAQIGDSFPLADRPRAISFFMSLSTSGQAMGIVIGSILAQYVSWKVLFILIGAGSLPAVLLFLKQLKFVQQPLKSNQSLPLKGVYRKLFSSQKTWILYGTVLLEGAVFFGGFTYLGVYANQELGLNYLAIGLVTALYSVAALVGSRLITQILSRIGQLNMLVLGSSIMTLAYLLMWISPTVIALACGFIILGIGFSFAHSTLQTFATELLPEARGTSMSLFAFFLFLGTGIGPIWIGKIYDQFRGHGMLGASVISFVLFTLVCATLFRRTLQQRNPS